MKSQPGAGTRAESGTGIKAQPGARIRAESGAGIKVHPGAGIRAQSGTGVRTQSRRETGLSSELRYKERAPRLGGRISSPGQPEPVPPT